MKAALLMGPSEVDVVNDWPEPSAGPGEVVVEIAAVGLCGSDVAVSCGDWKAPRYPWLLGHEAYGRICALGEDVEGRDIGERVVIEPNFPCMSCEVCISGRTSLCPRRRVVAMSEPGLLCERAAVPARFAWHAPESVEAADLLCTEPAAVAHSAIRNSGIGPGDSAVVIGAGTQGLLVCQQLMATGIPVSVVEPQHGRLEIAVEMGARPADNRDAPALFVFETSGSESGLWQCLELVAGGGRVVLIGIPHADVTMPVPSIVRRQLHLIGASIYDHPGGFRDTLGLIESRTIQPGTILRRRFGLDAAGEAFASASSRAGKSWIEVRGDPSR